MDTPHFFSRFRTFPSLGFAFLFGIGIVLATWFPSWHFGTWTFLWALSAALFFIQTAYRSKRLVNLQPFFRLSLLFSMILLLGSLRQAIQQEIPAHHIRYFTQEIPQEIHLQGKLINSPIKTKFGMRFILNAEKWRDKNISKNVSGLVQVRVALPEDIRELPPIQQGDVISLQGALQLPFGKRNPADFDERTYLAHKSVFSSLYVREFQSLQRISSQQTAFENIVFAVRKYVEHSIPQVIHNLSAQKVIKALILGDQSDLSAETRADFSKTGLTHILAISGLHILLIGMLLYEFLRIFLLRMRGFRASWEKLLSWQRIEYWRAFITLGVLLVYTALTGATPSVVRATVMCAVFIGGNLMQRSVSTLNSLGISALLLFAWQPQTLFDIGFQLSFAAVGGILLFQPLFETVFAKWIPFYPQTWQEKLKKNVFDSSAVSFQATLATAPVLLFHFGNVSLAGLLLNLIAIPISNVALLSGIVSLLFAGWLPLIANLLGATAEFSTWLLLQVASYGNAWLGAFSIRGYVDNLWTVLALIAAIFMLSQWFTTIRWKIGLVGLTTLSMSIWTSNFDGSHVAKLKVLFFDVGQGDATLIQFPNGKTMLIDAGNANEYGDAGLSTIYPHLQRFGISKLDAVLISHPHNDHQGGLPSLMRRIPIQHILTNGQKYDSPAYYETLLLADSLNVGFHLVKAGQTLDLDANVQIRILSPETTPQTEADVNNNSVVLQMRYGNTSFLFTGDAGAETEAALVSRYGASLQSHVVKVGHHGSRTSSIPEFVQAVSKPSTYSVMSVARKNRYGLPDEEIVSRWQAHSRLVQTSWDHAAWFVSDGKDVQRLSF